MIFWSEVVTEFFNAKVLRKSALVRSVRVSGWLSTIDEGTTKDEQRSKLAGSPEATVQVTVIGLEE